MPIAVCSEQAPASVDPAGFFGGADSRPKAVRIEGEIPEVMAGAFVEKLFADYRQLEQAIVDHLAKQGRAA